MATAKGLRSTPWIASRACLNTRLGFKAGRVAVPAVEEAVEGAEQEVAGPACGVD